MKAILMSIKKQHNRNIEAGKKTSELRKCAPKCEYPIKVYTYESGYSGRHKVVNEWICKDVTEWCIRRGVPAHLPKVACVSAAEILKYSGNSYDNVVEMKISDLKIYYKPKELEEFRTPETRFHEVKRINGHLVFGDGYKGGKVITRPPQSWCYVEEI